MEISEKKKVITAFLAKRIVSMSSDWSSAIGSSLKHRTEKRPELWENKELIINEYNNYKRMFDAIMRDAYDLQEIIECDCDDDCCCGEC